MPELPDLQVFSKNLAKQLAGKTVQSISLKNTKQTKASERDFKSAFEHQKLEAIERVGKELYFRFANKNILALHLMLRGKLHLFEEKNIEKYTIIELLFTDGTGLAMTDFQGNATPTVNPEPRTAPDALADEVDVAFMKEQLNTRAAIKNVLLDQHIIRGIGNAYADEILWDARISPFSLSNKIPDEKIKALVKSIKHVLKDAEYNILKTHTDIISGEVRDFLKIHNPKKDKSPDGAAIQIKPGSRKTYYTDEQILYK